MKKFRFSAYYQWRFNKANSIVVMLILDCTGLCCTKIWNAKRP